MAVEETLRGAKRPQGFMLANGGLGYDEADLKPVGKSRDRRVGVIRHTQGSGKSLARAFYTYRIILRPAAQYPTVVVITDRTDLDDQLFGTIARCKDLLR